MDQKKTPTSPTKNMARTLRGLGLTQDNKKGETPLTEVDRLNATLQETISRKGELAELAFSTFDPRLLWTNQEDLLKEGGILNGYTAFLDSELIADFKGAKTGVQVTFTFNKVKEELTIAFSGTSDSKQFEYVTDFSYANLHSYNGGSDSVGVKKDASLGAKGKTVRVHKGFLTVYGDLEQQLIDNLYYVLSGEGSSRFKIRTISIVGHSLGAALVSVFTMMLLEDKLELLTSKGNSEVLKIPQDVKLNVYLFGCPRIGPLETREYYLGLVKAFRDKRGEDAFKDYSVRIYNDWATSLTTGDYKHLAENPIYEVGGSLYKIHSEDFDCSLFDVKYPDNNHAPLSKLPGDTHNLYNDRDFLALMQKLIKFLREKKQKEASKL